MTATVWVVWVALALLVGLIVFVATGRLIGQIRNEAYSRPPPREFPSWYRQARRQAARQRAARRAGEGPSSYLAVVRLTGLDAETRAAIKENRKEIRRDTAVIALMAGVAGAVLTFLIALLVHPLR